MSWTHEDKAKLLSEVICFDGCWVHRHKARYAMFYSKVSKKRQSAHKTSFEIFNGNISKGYVPV